MARARWAGPPLGRCAALWPWRPPTLLGDRPDLFIPYGVMVSTLTGVVGGLFGQLDAQLRVIIKGLQSGGK